MYRLCCTVSLVALTGCLNPTPPSRQELIESVKASNPLMALYDAVDSLGSKVSPAGPKRSYQVPGEDFALNERCFGEAKLGGGLTSAGTSILFPVSCDEEEGSDPLNGLIPPLAGLLDGIDQSAGEVDPRAQIEREVFVQAAEFVADNQGVLQRIAVRGHAGLIEKCVQDEFAFSDTLQEMATSDLTSIRTDNAWYEGLQARESIAQQAYLELREDRPFYDASPLNLPKPSELWEDRAQAMAQILSRQDECAGYERYGVLEGQYQLQQIRESALAIVERGDRIPAQRARSISCVGAEILTAAKLGNTERLSVSRDHELRILSIPANEDTTITLDVSSGSRGDPELYVYDTDCDQIAYNDDGGRGNNAKISLDSSSYAREVIVRAKTRWGGGDVDLRIELGPDPTMLAQARETLAWYDSTFKNAPTESPEIQDHLRILGYPSGNTACVQAMYMERLEPLATRAALWSSTLARCTASVDAAMGRDD